MENKNIPDPNLEPSPDLTPDPDLDLNQNLSRESEPDPAWLDELLHQPALDSEIGPDEGAVSAAGLSDISDLEFERIMQEALAEQVGSLDTLPAEQVPYDGFADEYADDGMPVQPEPGTELPSEDVKEPKEPIDPTKPVRKVRPKRKKGYGLFGLPHLLSTVIWIALVVFIGSTLGRLLWVCTSDVLAFGREDRTVYISITESDNLESISEKLHAAGLVRYKEIFKVFADLTGADEKISAGTFKLNTLYDYSALINGMKEKSSYRESVKVVIPEGFTCAQIFELLEEKGVCSAQKMESYAAESDFADYWFLEGIRRGDKYTLEGFLFPDTYQFYTDSDPRLVYIKFLERFEEQLDEDFQTYLDALNQRLAEKLQQRGYDQAFINSKKFDMYDVLTLASIIEKESAHTGENYDISSVFFNRLSNPGQYPKLNSDATVVYAHGGKTEDLDYTIDSPYNTYVVNGLPAGPIGNPGLSAILAALSPADTGYYYFVKDPSIEEHLFSSTYEEHQDKVNKIEAGGNG